MTIIKAFNESEGIDILNSGLSVVTTGRAIQPGVNRAALHFRGAANANVFCQLPRTLQEGWLRFYGSPCLNTASNSNGTYHNSTYLVGIQDTNGSFLFGLYTTPNRLWAADYTQLTNTGTDLTGMRAAGNWDFYWRLHPVSGVYRIYYNEALVHEFIGNTMPTDSNRVGRFYLRPAGYGTNPNDVGYDTSSTWANFIISTTPTFGGKVYTLAIEGAGSLSGWQGDPLSIAGINPNIANGLLATVDNQTSTFDIRTLDGLAPGVEVNAIVISTVSRYAENSEVRQQSGVVKIGESIYETQPKDVLTPSAGPLQHIFEVSPAGGVDWDVALVNSAEFGVRAKLVL